MSSWLFDTSALLAHYRAEIGAARIQLILDDPEAEILISTVSIAEFSRRLLVLGADNDAARATALAYANLADLTVPVDAALAVRAFEIGAACAARLPLIDAFIAASALTHSAILVHLDPHFSSIPASLLRQENLGLRTFV